MPYPCYLILKKNTNIEYFRKCLRENTERLKAKDFWEVFSIELADDEFNLLIQLIYLLCVVLITILFK